MRSIFLAAAATTFMLAAAAQAGVGYIRDADVEKGELEFEYEFVGSYDDDASKDGARSHKIESYYGFTDSLAIGGGAKFVRSSFDDTDLDSVFIETIYQFIEEDEMGFNLAVLGEYVHTVEDNSADKIEAKILYSNEWGNGFITRANLIAEQQVGPDSNTSPELLHRISTVFEISDYFAPGIEWHAEYGHMNDFDMGHYVGPVVYGELLEFDTGEHESEIEYEIGYLFGLNDNTADGNLRFLLEYEIEF